MVSLILPVQVGSAAFFPSLPTQGLLHEVGNTTVPCLTFMTTCLLSVIYELFYGKYHGNVGACEYNRYQAAFSPPSQPGYETKLATDRVRETVKLFEIVIKTT